MLMSMQHLLILLPPKYLRFERGAISPAINPPTGIYPEDGLHPNSRGYAFISRIIIEAINGKFGFTIPLTNISSYKPTALPIP